MPDPATDIFLGSFLNSLSANPTLQSPQTQMVSTASMVPDVLGRAGQQQASQPVQQGTRSPAQGTPQKPADETQTPAIDPMVIQQALALQSLLAGGGGIQGISQLLGVPQTQGMFGPFQSALPPQMLAQGVQQAAAPSLLQILQPLLGSLGSLPPALSGTYNTPGMRDKTAQQFQFDQNLIGPAIAALAALAGGV